MERLAMSVLQFGDQDYDHEHTSVSDAKNKSFLKFLHKVDEGYATTGVDSNVQPGGDLNNYLRDLKSSSSNHSGNMRISKSRESLELQAILRGLDNTGNWPLSYSQDGASDRQSVGQFTRPVSRVSSRGASPGYRYCLLRKRFYSVWPPSTPRSSYQVLSAKKLCASIRSGSYLGRPSSTVSVNDDDDDILESDAGQVTSATICRPVWTPAESMDDSLLDARHDDTDSDGGKRRGKERSFLTNNSQLYKVDEENTSEVKSYRSGRSGRKSRSKRSKSGTGSEEDDDAVSVNEFSLPMLESDRLLGQEKDAHAIAAELDALGLRKKSKGELTYPLLAPGKRPKAPPEKAKIPDHIAEALNRQTDASIEYLEQDLERRGFLKDGKVTALVGETLSGPTLEAVGEGLTEEELELAKQILQQKLDEAKGTLDGKQPAAKVKGKKPAAGKPGKKGGKKGKGKSIEEEKSQEELDREAIREKHEQEKKLEYLKMREQEAAELQKKIAEKQRMLKEQNDLSSARSKELQEEMERLEREAEAIQRAEDEAREILADVRKKQREERETRRKADLERKKQEALDRREREKKEMEDKRRKEMEMMEKIADAEMRRRMKEEEERRIDEEERLAQEKYEEEMREAQRMEEEEEERLKELERQAEEEAMQRLIEEREAAERERRRLREEEEALRDAENIRRQAMEEEHQRLEAERRKMQEAEDAKREAERQRLLELRRLEQEARIKMQEEIEKRRTDALARRDYNLENRQHVDKLRHYQGITRAWTFSYFVQWPRETYESHGRRKLERRNRPIGAGDPRKVVKINNPKPKKPADVPPESGEAPAPAIP
ncbi:trichohyalin-like isoform X15 [Ruditapes philippinarum]|uniref:trichohyalin-like isoform X15 n=1 Tax=Ruditapes philippinarum TaxID=129788 RepID=UPI00295B1C1A|nr:trichohyalin-like isoform X15 [Ruditapes philippinarum]